MSKAMTEKKKLCVSCAKLKGAYSNGYITCPIFPKKKEAKEYGMTVFLHCFCSEYEPKVSRSK